ncbi:aspartate--tRNA(Asn) ligase [Candidatus Nitrosocosmicus arcticus]|uniref:Aspartate--tRNA ligase n=1 Tax=Candidatus Nitrosocosmicus arcticus TaxID=2035267 RepID=A0A557SYT6_9ARCH|nr:aspartate--tRNA(Asn) ligase [Candidatus Nitrosocosmicus arcticus]TVP41767.1 Aspartate-tRNA ligase [Candidatus Nitrosocosmicus arcticus]
MEDKIIAENELGDWRRSHYSFQISNSVINQVVTVIGWISSRRDHGNVLFVQLRDRFGDTQILVKKKELSETIFESLKSLKEHSSIAIRGRVVEQKNSSNEFEIMPEEVKILSVSNKSAPFLTQAISSIGIDTRLDLRAIDLRRNHLQNVFKIRNTILNSIRGYLSDNYFVEVNTPKMIATATEGGAALFPIFYYDREAFLAQSPQLYKEQLTMAFENVFEIAPIFRAEPSRTNRHLSEAMSIDVEKAYVDYNDMMDYLDNLIRFVIQSINEKNQMELKSLGIDLPDMSRPFSRITYSQLIENLQNSHKYIRWGDDISPKLLKDVFGDEFYFITDWPASTKPFYVKSKKMDLLTDSNTGDDSHVLSESFDLMYGSLELSSGSTRINNKVNLMDNMKKKGLSHKAFDYHLRVFDYGVPPHAGFGLGLERLLMAILKLDNIRDATFYPRDIDRLTP